MSLTRQRKRLEGKIKPVNAKIETLNTFWLLNCLHFNTFLMGGRTSSISWADRVLRQSHVGRLLCVAELILHRLAAPCVSSPQFFVFLWPSFDGQKLWWSRNLWERARKLRGEDFKFPGGFPSYSWGDGKFKPLTRWDQIDRSIGVLLWGDIPQSIHYLLSKVYNI